MSYGVARWVLGSKAFLSLQTSEVSSIKQANSVRACGVKIEDNFNVIMENYFEFENDLMKVTLKDMMFHAKNHHDYQLDKSLFNRRIINIMTSCRSYLDQLKHIVGQEVNDAEEIIASIEAYDTSLSYRVMEALRNYSQHRGFPVHGVSYEGTWEGDEEENKKRMKNVVHIYMDLLVVSSDDRFKKKTAVEMSLISNKWELKTLIAEYIEGIAKIHQHVRDILKAIMIHSDSVIDCYKNRFKETYPDEHLVGLCVTNINADGTRTHVCNIFDGARDYRAFLEKKNMFLTNISKRYATSR